MERAAKLFSLRSTGRMPGNGMGCLGKDISRKVLEIRKPVYFNDSVIKCCNRSPRVIHDAPN